MGIKVIWHGHATWQLQIGGASIVVDPFFDQNPSAKTKAADVAAQYILISHGHFDHIADAVAIAQRTGAQVLANFEVAQWLSQQGVPHTIGMNLGGQYQLPWGTVRMTPAWHSSTLPDGTAGGTPAGFVLEAEGKKIYFACDTALFTDMSLIGNRGIDLAVVPIGDLYTMGIDDSLEAIRLIRPRRVLPTHYNTWPPIAQDAALWARRVKAETEAEPWIAEVGSPLEL